MTFKLPRGITGFRDDHEPPLNKCDFHAFSAHCHTAARLFSATIVSIETALAYPANFSQTTIQFHGDVVTVLLNSIEPFVAFAEPIQETDWRLKFIEHADLADYFATSGQYRVLTAAEANETLRPETYRNLGDAELAQIRYWKPQTVGEVIYNHWD